MAAVTIRYTRRVLGHPDPGAVVTVERTDVVEHLLGQGYAVEIPAEIEIPLMDGSVLVVGAATGIAKRVPFAYEHETESVDGE